MYWQRETDAPCSPFRNTASGTASQQWKLKVGADELTHICQHTRHVTQLFVRPDITIVWDLCNRGKELLFCWWCQKSRSWHAFRYLWTSLVQGVCLDSHYWNLHFDSRSWLHKFQLSSSLEIKITRLFKSWSLCNHSVEKWCEVVQTFAVAGLVGKIMAKKIL